jgi:hypothetical protein
MPAEPSPCDVKSVNLEVLDKPGRRGRPVTLTIRRFVSVCYHIEQGFSIPNACEVEGVSYRNFRFRVSQSARLQGRLKEAETVRFNLRHEQALASILAAGERSWMAHAWFLERALPHLYALRNVVRADPEGGQELKEEIPAEVLAKHRALMLQMAKEDEARADLAQGESVG